MAYDSIEDHGGYTISRKRYNSTDPRLGRHVRHDSRSLAFQVKEKATSDLKSVRHTRNIPVLDQGNLGSCTGNAGTGAMGTAQFWDEGQTVLSPTDATKDEAFAVELYSDATKVDSYGGSYPPTDTGSDGLSVAQVLKKRGLIEGYTHATTLNAALTAIEAAPCIVGIEWREDMFNPDADGRVHITGQVAGGHEIVFDEIDVENQRVWFTNSWNTSWGVDGRAYLTWADFNTLLKAEGDVTQFSPIVVAPQPEPTPTPQPEPTPTPGPVNPQPAPTPTPDDKAWLQKLKAAAEQFVDTITDILNAL